MSVSPVYVTLIIDTNSGHEISIINNLEDILDQKRVWKCLEPTSQASRHMFHPSELNTEI